MVKVLIMLWCRLNHNAQKCHKRGCGEASQPEQHHNFTRLLMGHKRCIKNASEPLTLLSSAGCCIKNKHDAVEANCLSQLVRERDEFNKIEIRLQNGVFDAFRSCAALYALMLAVLERHSRPDQARSMSHSHRSIASRK